MTEQILTFIIQVTCTSKRWLNKQVAFLRESFCWTVVSALAGLIKFVRVWTKNSSLPQVWPQRSLICWSLAPHRTFTRLQYVQAIPIQRGV